VLVPDRSGADHVHAGSAASRARSRAGTRPCTGPRSPDAFASTEAVGAKDSPAAQQDRCKQAINKRFHYNAAPAGRRVACSSVKASEQTCRSSWRTKRFRYSGTVSIFTKATDNRWHYKMNLKRTDRRTNKTRKIRVA
jgi:hypothetical protein